MDWDWWRFTNGVLTGIFLSSCWIWYYERRINKLCIEHMRQVRELMEMTDRCHKAQIMAIHAQHLKDIDEALYRGYRGE